MKIKFYHTDLNEIKQSAYYPIDREEIINYFRQHPVPGLKVFKRLEKNERVDTSLTQDRRINFHFIPGKDGNYYFQITKNKGVRPSLDEDLIKLIEDKEPIKPESKQLR